MEATHPKNIVLCSDGTGNSANKGRGTNVFKLFEAVNTAGGRQLAFYDDGVGTERWKPVKLIAGAFGLGLSRNVRQLYAMLCRVYEEDDRLYLFGFSRGAFTVRTLAGFILKFGVININKEGLSNAELTKKINKAYKLYRNFAGLPPKHMRSEKDHEKWRQAEAEAEEFRQESCLRNWNTMNIQFVGVWDTVDAVGTPWDPFTKLLNKRFHFKFSDRSLSNRVLKGRHAISIDDERRTFRPVMWTETGDNEDQIKQIWFAGVHSNIGGGYPKQGMSLVTLNWMMKEATDAGLDFIDSTANIYEKIQNVNDRQYNSRVGLATYYKYKPRDIAKLSAKYGIEVPKIHESVFRRIALRTEGYAPGNVPADFSVEFTWNVQTDEKTLIENTVKRANVASGGPDTLIERHFWLVRGRRISQTVFLFVTFVAVFLAIKSPQPAWLGETWIASGLDALLPSWAVGYVLRLFGNPYILLPVATCGFLAWLVGRTLRLKQEHLYSKFWSNINMIVVRPEES